MTFRILIFANGPFSTAASWVAGDSEPSESNLIFATRDGEQITMNAALDDQQWYHMAATVQDGAVSLYLNGNLLGAANLTAAYNDESGEAKIGGYKFGEYNMVGRMDEVKIFSSALSAAEIAAAALPTSPVPEPSSALMSAAGLALLGSLAITTAPDQARPNPAEVARDCQGPTPLMPAQLARMRPQCLTPERAIEEAFSTRRRSSSFKVGVFPATGAAAGGANDQRFWELAPMLKATLFATLGPAVQTPIARRDGAPRRPSAVWRITMNKVLCLNVLSAAC